MTLRRRLFNRQMRFCQTASIDEKKRKTIKDKVLIKVFSNEDKIFSQSGLMTNGTGTSSLISVMVFHTNDSIIIF